MGAAYALVCAHNANSRRGSHLKRVLPRFRPVRDRGTEPSWLLPVISASIFRILLPNVSQGCRYLLEFPVAETCRARSYPRVPTRSFSLKTGRFRNANEQLVDNHDALAIAIRLPHKLRAVMLRQYFRPRRMSEHFTLKRLHLLPSSNPGD